MIMLMLLLYNIINQTFGLVAIDNKIDPATLAVDGVPIEELDQQTLIAIIEENVSKGKFRQLERVKPLDERTWEEVYQVVIEDVVQPNDIVGTWSLVDSLTHKDEILAEVEQKHPNATVQFTSWIDPQFVTSPQSSDVLKAGVRTALLGTLLIIAITIVIALPVGIGAAIYLEEYASDNWVNRTIQTNINNLAGFHPYIWHTWTSNLCSAMEP
jgi:phosphate transport system permease protein